MKRVLAIILSLMISVCFLPVSGIQAEEDNDWIETESPEETEPEEKWDEESVENGWAGKQATCTVSKDGTLTVKGKGSVKLKFTITGGKTEKHIRKVVIKEGITRIADYGTSLDKAMKICLPRSLVTLGYGAFSWNYSLVSLCLPDGIRKLPDVQKKGYTFLGWRSLKGNLHIPQKFPAERGDDIKLTAMLIQLKVERISETIVKFTIKDSIKWDSGGGHIFLAGRRLSSGICSTYLYQTAN